MIAAGKASAPTIDEQHQQQLIYLNPSRSGSQFGGLATNVKASFGVFVSDVVLRQVTPLGDTFEIAVAAVAAISLVWCLLGAGRSTVAPQGGGLVGSFVDVLELLESVGVVFVIRLALQHVQSSLTSIHSQSIYCATSLVLFFCFDAFGRIGGRTACPYTTWQDFDAAVDAARVGDAWVDEAGWQRMLRPLSSSIAPG
jgi:hypothetical protein